MRSKLFVPGLRAELFAKALASDADAVSFDLEDSVLDERKADARARVAELLRSDAVSASKKIIITRVNGVDTQHFEADIRAIMRPALDIVNLPKVESADQIRAAASFLEKAEAANGVTTVVRILANIETARGLRHASEIAAAHPRIAGLQLGMSDLFGSLEIDRQDGASIHAAMFAMRMAAGEAGVFAYDGAFADIRDEAGFRAEAEMARRLGYWGKSCIHPRQIALANKVFVPSEEDIAFASRVIKASRQAALDGVGAFAVDGTMIDRPIIKHAESVIAEDRRLRENR